MHERDRRARLSQRAREDAIGRPVDVVGGLGRRTLLAILPGAVTLVARSRAAQFAVLLS